MTLISSLGNSLVGGPANRPVRYSDILTRHVKKRLLLYKRLFAYVSGSTDMTSCISFRSGLEPFAPSLVRKQGTVEMAT